MKIPRRYNYFYFILIGIRIGILMMSLKINLTSKEFFPRPYAIMTGNDVSHLSYTNENRLSSPIFLETDLYKMPYQLDYPLNFERTPQYARLPQPPCRSFGEWVRNICHNNLTVNYVNYTLIDLVNLIISTEEYIQPSARYIINGGAHDGLDPDPLYPLFTKLGCPGIAIEVAEDSYEKLKVNLPADNITKLNAALEPHTVHQLFINNRVPFRPLIMKLDIDGYDYTVLRSIFIHISNNSRTQYQPALVLVEMNEKFPPPIHFYTRYRSSYGYEGDHLYGASITAWTHLLSFELGYILLGYWNRSERDEKFSYNRNVQHWNDPNKTILMKYRDILKYLHSSKTFTNNIECSYFLDVRPLYIEPTMLIPNISENVSFIQQHLQAYRMKNVPVPVRVNN